MIHRLLYPDHQHDRGPDPGPFQNIEKYKPYLRYKFRRKCIYCRIPDTWRAEIYEVEHYLPKAAYPDLERAWSNLFYACHICNQRKGAIIRRIDLFIPNPCDDIMAKHLQFREADIEAFTACGRFMVDQLRLDREDLRQLRRRLFRSIRNSEEALNEYLKALDVLEEQASRATTANERGRIEKDIFDMQANLRDVADYLEFLTGEPVTQAATSDQES